MSEGVVVEEEEILGDGTGVLMFTGRVLLSIRSGTPMDYNQLLREAIKVGLVEVHSDLAATRLSFSNMGQLCIDQVPEGTIQ